MAYGALPRHFSPRLGFPARNTRSFWRPSRGIAIFLLSAFLILYIFNPLHLDPTISLPTRRHHLTVEESKQIKLQKLEAAGGDPLLGLDPQPDPLAPGPAYGAPARSTKDHREHYDAPGPEEQEKAKQLLNSGVGPDEWEAIQEEEETRREQDQEKKKAKLLQQEDFKRTKLEEEKRKKKDAELKKAQGSKNGAISQDEKKIGEDQRKEAEAADKSKDRDKRPNPALAKSPKLDTTPLRPSGKTTVGKPSIGLDPTQNTSLTTSHTNLTSTLVVGHLVKEELETLWLWVEVNGVTHKRVYVVDDLNATLHLKKNKGREAMVYLKYIIDYYDDLDDVTLFFHPSREAWHNSILFNRDAAIMINQLNRSHVVEQGYMNARCERYPGCSDTEKGWLKFNPTPEEEHEHWERGSGSFTTKLWNEIFPDRKSDPVYLGQPCCSQFAVSKDKLRSIPKSTYSRLHDWLGTSEEDDSYTGRVMEYTWQYLFLGEEQHCPDMRECYCKGYGLCLGDQGAKRLQQYNTDRAEIDSILTKVEATDKANGCDDISDESEHERKEKCLNKNIWLPSLFATRQSKTDLETELPMKYGIMQPGGKIGDGIGKISGAG